LLVYCLTMFDVCHMFVLKYYEDKGCFKAYHVDLNLVKSRTAPAVHQECQLYLELLISTSICII